MSDDLQRSLGRVEGAQKAMEDRLTKLEDAVAEGFADVKQGLEAISRRLEAIEATETERKGAWKVIVAVAGVVASGVAALFKYFGG